jgi:hypothetical protein
MPTDRGDLCGSITTGTAFRISSATIIGTAPGYSKTDAVTTWRSINASCTIFAVTPTQESPWIGTDVRGARSTGMDVPTFSVLRTSLLARNDGFRELSITERRQHRASGTWLGAPCSFACPMGEGTPLLLKRTCEQSDLAAARSSRLLTGCLRNLFARVTALSWSGPIAQVGALRLARSPETKPRQRVSA